MHYLFFGTSKTFFGQVSYNNLLVPGQVSTFAISTPWLKVNSLFSHLSLSVDSNNTGSCIMWCRDKDGISTDSVHVDTGG